MSPLFSNRPAATTLNVRERTRGWLTALNLHWAGVALLALVNLYLLVNMALAYQKANSANADAIAREQVALKTAQIAEKPLEGLDTKLHTASEAADQFYLERLPSSYYEIASEIGVLAKKQTVRLTRVQYAQSPVEGEAAGQLTEVRMDASLSGDYRGLVVFLNSLERDKLFFLISGVTLTGQQTGTVNLRIRITTYLRGTASTDDMQKVSVGTEEKTAAVADEPLVPSPEKRATR